MPYLAFRMKRLLSWTANSISCISRFFTSRISQYSRSCFVTFGKSMSRESNDIGTRFSLLIASSPSALVRNWPTAPVIPVLGSLEKHRSFKNLGIQHTVIRLVIWLHLLKQTPVPLCWEIFPNIIDCTMMAVPMLGCKPIPSRILCALSLNQVLKIDLITFSSCS